jgi:hypothetical protein
VSIAASFFSSDHDLTESDPSLSADLLAPNISVSTCQDKTYVLNVRGWEKIDGFVKKPISALIKEK